MNISILSLLSVLATTFASPILNSNEGSQPTCTDLSAATSHLPSDSISFCSSFLQIQTSTITTQAMVTQATPLTLTSPLLTTITDPVTIPVPITSTSTTTEVVTTTTTIDFPLTVTDIDPVTLFSTITSTSTVTAGSSSPEYTFLPGNPPPQIRETNTYDDYFEGDEEDYEYIEDECLAPEPEKLSTVSTSYILLTPTTSQATLTATGVLPLATNATFPTTSAHTTQSLSFSSRIANATTSTSNFGSVTNTTTSITTVSTTQFSSLLTSSYIANTTISTTSSALAINTTTTAPITSITQVPYSANATTLTTPVAVTTDTTMPVSITSATQSTTFSSTTKSPIPSSILSSACACLSIPTPTSTVTNTQILTLLETFTVPGQASSIIYTLPTTVPGSTVLETVTVTSTTTSTLSAASLLTATALSTTIVPVTTTVTTTVSATPEIQTVYPCASPLPTLTPTLPYGDYSSPSNLGLRNSIYYLNTPQGNSATACCNTCYFGTQNCVQAYFYAYQGCVISQASDLSSAMGKGISGVCPAGVFGGLTYRPDTNPAFRSTGNIAGPCGQSYSNF